MIVRFVSLVLGTAAALGVACQSDGSKQDEQAAPADQSAPTGAEPKPVVDSKIAKAMARSEPDNTPPSSPSAPVTGILTEEEAQRQAPLDAPLVLTLGSEGAPPRRKLAQWVAAEASRRKGHIVVGGRSPGGVLPSVAVQLASQVPKGQSLDAPGKRLRSTVQLVSAVPSAQQPGQLPPGAAESIASLNGSQVLVPAGANGEALPLTLEVSKGSPEVRPIVDGVVTALAASTLPLPNKPVGVGAYWMVKSREVAGGMDTVVYRMLRVIDLSESTARLTLDTRRYLVGSQVQVEGLSEHTVRQFEAQGQGVMTLAMGEVFPTDFELSESVLAMVAPANRPGQVLPLQVSHESKMQWDVPSAP